LRDLIHRAEQIHIPATLHSPEIGARAPIQQILLGQERLIFIGRARGLAQTFSPRKDRERVSRERSIREDIAGQESELHDRDSKSGF
jgi:hypothetical protein